MPSSFRPASLALALAIAGCSPAATPPRSCATDAECPADARCLAGACVANAPPIPAIALPPAPLQANVLLTFDGSGSADPDEGDEVVDFAWAFRAIAAPCAPPAVASAAPQATVRFACPGRYAAQLTVTDALGRSATRADEFDVAPLEGPALLAVGPDVALDHACSSGPTRCAPSGEVALSASAPTVGSPDLAFRWAVEPPPDRPLDANRRVAFAPHDRSPTPSVSIETDGQAISGDWIFRVEARDAAGVVGTAAVRVSIGNRAPVVQETIPPTGHAFDGARFTAGGAIPFTVSDPDGDPLEAPVLGWRHVGDGDGAFSAELLEGPARVAFSIEVPYGSREDALHLIGGEGLERTVTFAVTDANGATTAEAWPIVVENRPPALVSAPAAFTVPHVYDPQGRAYRATVGLSSWSDPDGDPLWQVPTSSTGDPDCPSFAIADGTGAREAVADCSLPFDGTPAVANFAGSHVVAQAVQDPWVAASQSSAVAFTIANSPPAITSSAPHVVAGGCTANTPACCSWTGGECVAFDYSADALTLSVASRWSDPDGDPLDVRATAVEFVTPVQPLVCTPSECALVLDLAALEHVCASEGVRLATSVSDGMATASGPLDVVRACDF